MGAALGGSGAFIAGSLGGELAPQLSRLEEAPGHLGMPDQSRP
jgi:hypothetical protein